MTRNIQKWKQLIWDDQNHPKLDNFVCDQIIIHLWMIMYGNFHPILDQEHTFSVSIAMNSEPSRVIRFTVR